MKKFGLCLALVLSSALCLAETQPAPEAPNDEPKLYDHYLTMQQMQMKLGQRSLDEQQRLQPQMRRAELAACQRLKKDREEGVSAEVYREQGGAQFYAFTQDFERYCQTLSP
jgi:hypothetical protein